MNIKILVCVLFFIALSLQGKACKQYYNALHCKSWEELKNGNFSNFQMLTLRMNGTKFQLLDEEFFTHEKFNSLEEFTLNGGNITFQEGVFRRLENLEMVRISSVESKFLLKGNEIVIRLLTH